MLTGTQLAILTGRTGAGRSGASRTGFAPTKTRGLTPGSSGPFYLWARVYKATAAWIAVRRT